MADQNPTDETVSLPVQPELTPRQVREARDKALREKRCAAIAKGREVIRLKKAAKAVILEKLKAGIPITPEEEKMVHWTASQKPQAKKDAIVDAAARLVIKSQSMEELRIVVEQTAARHAYNPIEELIKLTGPNSDLEDKEKVVIHKALLPFLIPQLPAPKEKKGQDNDENRVRVTITHFNFPTHREKPAEALHTIPPPMIGVTREADAAPAT